MRAGWTIAIAAAIATPASAQLIHEFIGPLSLDALGEAVEGVGDVNADGFADFAISRHGDSIGGRIDVYSGLTGTILYSVVDLHNEDGWEVSIDTGPDLTGDGVRDLLVGVSGDDSGAINTGSVRLVSGADGAELAKYSGTAPQEGIGRVVSFTEDIDGDGYPEILASDHWLSKVLVISGASGLVLANLAEGPGWSFGFDPAGGDVTGDGKGDVIVGSPKWQGTLKGAALVYSGASLTAPPIITIIGDLAQDDCGASVDSADVNSDGFDDIIVGCPGASSVQPVVGAIRVFLGPFGLPSFTAHGKLASEGLGRGLDTAMDLDEDGTQDILTRSFQTVRAFSGAGGAEFQLLVDANFALLSDVAWAGDVNGDGRADILIGDAAFAGKGRAQVWSNICGEVANYGSGCSGTGGVTPVLSAGGCMIPLSDLSVTLSKAIGPSIAFLLVGTTNGGSTLKGCPLNVGGMISFIQVLPVIGSGFPGSGGFSFDAFVPGGTPVGVDVFTQVFVLDPGGIAGYSSTNGVRIRFQ